MNNLRKGLALFLAVIMMISSFSYVGFAVEEDIYYTVETYLMDTSGKYSAAPITETFSADAGEMVELFPDLPEGFSFDSSKSEYVFVVQSDCSSVGKLYFSRNKYTATYYYEDLLGSQTEESLVYYGADIPSFEANPSGKPVKQGYDFVMWSLEENSRVDVPSTMPAKDINMYPIYKSKEYTYTFDAGEGGSFSDGSRIMTYNYLYGDVPSYPDEYPVMPHMEFVDWDNTIPSTVTKDLTFSALYNEIAYAAIFMDGEDEIAYLDGYYYGDVVEEVDIPEGYDAWTLSDGSYVEFPYTIEGNTVFYAAKSPSYYTVKFYTDINDTDPYEEFSVLQGDEIDFPADPEKEGHTFIGWNNDITVMPDEDVVFVAEWEVNEYNIIFDTNGGNPIDPVKIAFGDIINVPANINRDGFVFKGWEGMPEDGLMPSQDIILTAVWEKAVAEDSLSFRTELYTYDEAVGDWVVADKVERGEKVKARIFIETGFAVGTGQMLCFYDDDVFSMSEVSNSPLVVNTDASSTANRFKASGSFATPPKTHSTFTDLVDFGYISSDFLDMHSPVTFTFRFASFQCHAISGDEWFAEFDLTAKEDAVGTGDFFVVPETIVNSEDGYYAYITLTKGEEGGSSLSAEGMLSWNASTSVESNPVTTGYGRIILNADGGIFSSSDSEVFVNDYIVGEDIIYETPVKEGYLFAGWEPQIPDIMTEDIIESTALWVPCSDTSYKVLAHYYDFSNGEGVLTEKVFEFYGTTGYSIEIADRIPASPSENTEYILIDEFGFDYNEFDYGGENILNGYINADGSTVLEIYFIPVTHVVVFDADGGNFADGDSVKFIEVPHGSLAIENLPFAELVKNGYTFNGWFGLGETTRIISDITFMADWTVNTYTAAFDASGGTFADGNQRNEITVKFGETVIAPEPVLDGYEFIGWHDELGTEFDLTFMMPACDIVLIAEWKEIPVETTTQTTAAPTTTESTTVTTSVTETTSETEVITTAPTTSQPTETEPVTQPSITEPVTEPSTTEPVTEPSTTAPSSTQPSTVPSTVRPSSTVQSTEPTTKPVIIPTTQHTHKLITVDVKASCETSGEKYQKCKDCGQIIGDSSYVEPLGHDAGEWETVIQPTYDKVGKKVKKCIRCKKILEEAIIPILVPETVELSIKKPSITTIKYGDSIYLHAETELPAGAKVEWSANNANFTYSVSSDGMTCLITPSAKGETEFTAKVVDAKGNVISEICTQKMTSKAGFFQKIIAFFKRLFGLTKVYPESVVFVYDK